MPKRPSRREVIKLAGFAAAGLCLPAFPVLAHVPTRPPAPRKRVLRIAHLTDIHVQPERRGGEGFAACLRHVNSLADRPDLIITGGDQVMDTFEQGRERSKVLWDLWNACLKNDNGIPAAHVLGNHDIWGWNKKKSKCTGNEPGYGKAWACEQFGRDKPYTSFDRNGWHFILLDSIQPKGDGYIARLDDEQFAWLEADLKSLPAATPVAIFSHVPIFAVCVFSGAKTKNDPDNWRVSGGLMHSDARRLHALFLKHPGVKLCVSGHIHERDRVEYCGVTYVCDGAVCGRWWRGRHAQCDEGYGTFDLFDDGTFSHEYHTFGWKAGA
jgi:Predicted phosphohydrolases